MLYILYSKDSNDSAMVSEKVLPGELVRHDPADGKLRVATGADGRVDGVAAGMESAAWVAEDEDDFRTNRSDFAYYPKGHADADKYDGLFPVPYGGNTDEDELRLRTPTDNGTDPAPTFGPNSVVGIADSDANFAGRVVQEGYTDGASTPVTYNRSNGNFLPIGTVSSAAPEIRENDGSYSAFDSLLHVDRDKGL